MLFYTPCRLNGAKARLRREHRAYRALIAGESRTYQFADHGFELADRFNFIADLYAHEARGLAYENFRRSRQSLRPSFRIPGLAWLKPGM